MVMIRSKTGSFTKEQMERRWIEIGKIDEVDLKPISLKDVVGCHIIADRQMVAVQLDDNLMISKEIHNQMGHN